MANIFFPPVKWKQNGKFTVFLAGSIEMGVAENWQQQFIDSLNQYDINILNPRRLDWDSSWSQSIDNDSFCDQVTWELQGLASADLIIMYLQPATLSPISMLELGLFAQSGKLLVCCPDGFWRKGNIDIVCDHNNVRVCDNKMELFSITHAIIQRSVGRQ